MREYFRAAMVPRDSETMDLDFQEAKSHSECTELERKGREASCGTHEHVQFYVSVMYKYLN